MTTIESIFHEHCTSYIDGVDKILSKKRILNLYYEAFANAMKYEANRIVTLDLKKQDEYERPGLFSTQQILEIQGRDIFVESKISEGWTFSINLPSHNGVKQE